MALCPDDSQVANGLLLACPRAVLDRILPKAELVELVRGREVARPGDPVRSVYFINRGMVSLVNTMLDGRTVEVGARGIEGVIDPESLFGIDTAVLESIVQIEGSCVYRKLDSRISVV